MGTVCAELNLTFGDEVVAATNDVDAGRERGALCVAIKAPDGAVGIGLAHVDEVTRVTARAPVHVHAIACVAQLWAKDDAHGQTPSHCAYRQRLGSSSTVARTWARLMSKALAP